jgi:hypothetical protein
VLLKISPQRGREPQPGVDFAFPAICGTPCTFAFAASFFGHAVSLK